MNPIDYSPFWPLCLLRWSCNAPGVVNAFSHPSSVHAYRFDRAASAYLQRNNTELLCLWRTTKEYRNSKHQCVYENLPKPKSTLGQIFENLLFNVFETSNRYSYKKWMRCNTNLFSWTLALCFRSESVFAYTWAEIKDQLWFFPVNLRITPHRSKTQ